MRKKPTKLKVAPKKPRRKPAPHVEPRPEDLVALRLNNLYAVVHQLYELRERQNRQMDRIVAILQKVLDGPMVNIGNQLAIIARNTSTGDSG